MLHLRRPKNTPYLMISWWPPLLLAGHSHKLTTSWFWLSSPSQCAPTSQAENLVDYEGLRLRPYAYSVQGLLREHRQGRKRELLGSIRVPGRVPNSIEGDLGPQSLSDWALLALSLLKKKHVLFCSLVYFSKSLSTSLCQRAPKLATASAPERASTAHLWGRGFRGNVM